MRYALMVVWLLLSSVASAAVYVSVGIALPGISIGINLPAYPELVLVPGYPVYYAPRLYANYFFYDGMYWIYAEDDWYVSYWYNGPWSLVYPDYVPVFVLRIPVYYYRWPPVYFRGWRPGAPPRWGERWGHDWERRHSGWNQWDLSTAPPPAPLPEYQRQYSGDRYPHAEQQPQLHKKYYRYQPRDVVVRPPYQRKEERVVRPYQQQWQAEPQRESQERDYPPQRIQRYNRSLPPQATPAGPRTVTPHWREEDAPRNVPPVFLQRRFPDAQDQREQRSQEAEPPERQIHGRGIKSQDKEAPQQSRRFKGKGQNEDREGDGGETRYRKQIIRESE